MGIEASHVGVVGGSIAGCAAAIALRRAGCEVTVFERSPDRLRDRGIGLPVSQRDEFAAAGYLDAALPAHQTWERLWIVDDPGSPSASKTGRIAGRQPFVAALNNWGILWRNLRAGVAEGAYRQPVTVTDIEADADGATIVTDSGHRHRYDLVVGADGYRSGARRHVGDGTGPDYAGYVLWRGSYSESRLPGRLPSEFEHAMSIVCFPGGQGVFYLIPDFVGEQRRMNWAVYGALPERLRFDDPTSLPPGSVGDDVAAVLDHILATHFPPYWADVVRRTTRDELSAQPIYDVTASTYVAGRLLLIGDAAAVARPHTGAGAAKALADARALERACREHDTWERALAAYDEERRAAGEALVGLGQRLGAALVERTPTWDSLTPGEFETWMRAIHLTPYAR
ncbi:FAD-dependent monooxygenase [Actinoallomurus sp. NPDC050550]|uniref:FAD-dependent monooxygenase n=1 Tax=Actinoallomurus sp. NPDC050550 TaxID=3154937 RepID=UPI0033FF917A